VYQLVDGHTPEDILQKHYQPLFKMLERYDVENIYVCSGALKQRCLTSDMLMIDVTLLDTKELQQKLAQQDQLLSF
jgi:tRNA 2-thiouridine synthesizing protein C